MAIHYAAAVGEGPACGQRGHVQCSANANEVSCKRCLVRVLVHGVDMANGVDKTVMAMVTRDRTGHMTVVGAHEVTPLGLRMLHKEQRVRVLRFQEYEGVGDYVRNGGRASAVMARVTVRFKGSAAAFNIWSRTHELGPSDVVQTANVRLVEAHTKRGDRVVANYAFPDFACPMVQRTESWGDDKLIAFGVPATRCKYTDE